MIQKLETLLDETIELVKEARAYLQRCKPIDWTLLYGPRGTEIHRSPGPFVGDPPPVDGTPKITW